MITDADRERFSFDAIFLTARVTQEPWLSAAAAAEFDADLRLIRDHVPAVQEIHAYPDFDPNVLIVAVRISAPWLESWMRGILTTGIAPVDHLLEQFGAASVADLSRVPEPIRWDEERRQQRVSVITFRPPLNMPVLAQQLRVTSPHFIYIEPSRFAGDGDRITFEQDAEERRYTFSKGWGDCPSGCMSRHFWDFALTSDGDVRLLREYGAPLP